MGDVQANLADLRTFVRRARASADGIDTTASDRRSTFRTFAYGSGSRVGAESFSLVGAGVDSAIAEFREMADFVELVADALEQSDHYTGGDTVTIDSATLEAVMRGIANERGISYDDLVAVSEPLTVPLPSVGTVPRDSGWVNDPVLTATGHFVVVEHDLPMPARLAVLAWERTYASIGDTDHGLGRGWSSWLDAGLADRGTSIVVTDQHGRAVELATSPSGDPGTFEAADRTVTARRTAGTDIVVEWGRRSDRPYETWTFDGDGRLVEVAGDLIGTSSFRYDDGRLVGVDHDGGRSLSLAWDGGRLARIASSDGRVVEYRGSEGRLDAVDAPGCRQRYLHDDAGRVSAVVDADDVTLVELVYDDAGRVVEQREHAGGVTRFEYEAGGRTFVSDEDGVRRAGYVHDASGRVTMAMGAPLHPITRRFDEQGRTVHQTNLDGTQFHLTVERGDDGGTRELIHHDHGSVEVFDYDADDRLVAYACDGRRLVYEYVDGSTLPRRVVAHDGWSLDLEWAAADLVAITDADGVVSRFEYDRDGSIVAAIDGEGHRTEYEIHPSGARAVTRHPDGSVERAELDDAGRALTLVDPLGGEMRLEVSPAARLRSLTDPSGAVVTVVHDDRGRPSEIVDAAGYRCRWEVDSDLRPSRITLPDGSVRSIERDLAGRIVAATATDVTPSGTVERRWTAERSPTGTAFTVTSPGGRVTALSHVVGQVSEAIRSSGDERTSWRFDRSLGEQIVTDASGTTWTSTIEPGGRAVTCLSSTGDVTVYRYSPAGRLVAIEGPSRTVRFEYDARGEIVGRDEGAGMWRFERNERGWMWRVVSPMGREQTYRYDACGRIVATALGPATTTYEYDACGRLVAETEPGGRAVTYEYGPRGELLAAIDANGGTTSYEYDARRRLVRTIDPGGGVTRVEYAFGAQAAVVTDPAGRRRSYEYDLDGLLTAIVDGEGATGFEYDGRRRIVARTFRPADRPDIVDETRFEYAPSGEITAYVRDGVRTELPAPIDPPTASGVTFDLDGLGLAVDLDGYHRTVERDSVGRRIRVAERTDDTERERTLHRDASGMVVATEVDDRRLDFDFLSSGFLGAVTGPDGTTRFEYDTLGRLIAETTRAGRRTFAYDEVHQLVELVDEVGRASAFEHDSRGRRIASSGAVAARYEWDDLGLVAVTTSRGRTTFERDPFGYLTRITTPGGAVTDIEWDRTSPMPRPTRVGSDVVLTDGAVAVATRRPDGTVQPVPALTGPWGEIDHEPGEVTWHPFHGVHVDGLVVLGARVYDVATRQFLSPDPNRPVVGAASAGWQYCYAANDPVNMLDPLGLQPLSEEEFERIQDRYTGVQWGNVARAAVVVAAVALTPTGAGPLMLVAIGAGTGLASEFGGQVVGNITNTGAQGYDGGAIVRSTLVGGLTGPIRIPSRVPGFSQATRDGYNVFQRTGVNAVEGAMGGTVEELYDLVPVLPGADGRFDVHNVFINAGTNVVGGEIGDGISNVRARFATAPEAPAVSPQPTGPAASDPVGDVALPDLANSPAANSLPSGGASTSGTTPDAGGMNTGGTTTPAPSSEPLIKGNVGRNGERIYHTPESRYYGRTNPEQMFHTVEEAVEAGFRAPLQ